MRRIAILDAPSNLGLRPPTETSVPGCAKAPGALRDQGLLTRLHARDAGCLTPPRYDPGDWRPGDGVAHAAQIAAYSRALADRIGAILDAGEFPVILGGDCSILIGSGVAMHRLGEAVGGRIGLVFVDGHSDFRHPGNASYVGAAAGEDLALVTGRGQPDLASIEGRRPYFRDVDVVVMGIRAQDEYRLDLQAAGIVTRPVPALRAEGAARSAQWARDQLVDCAGYWVHIDVDVLDPAVMPAVDAPSPGGIAFPELELLLAGLVESPHCLGVELTVFDPDYDPDGSFAAEITSAVTAGLAVARTVSARPDLIAAREDLRSTATDDPARGRRRAAAANDSVPLAAAAMSTGPAEESAVPATTMLGVEEAGDLSAALGIAPGIASDAAGDQPESDEATAEDDPAGGISAFEDQADGDPVGKASSYAEPVDEASADEESTADASADEIAGEDPADDSADEDSIYEQFADQIPVDHDLGDEDPTVVAASDGADGYQAAAEETGGGLDSVEAVSYSDGYPGDASAGDVHVENHRVDGGAEADEGGTDGVADDDGFGGVADEDVAADGSDHLADLEPEDDTEPDEHAERTGLRLLSRPLGSAPLLDSEPLPATRPGMLRPRATEDGRNGETFSLPIQRPAFDVGSDAPADIT